MDSLYIARLAIVDTTELQEVTNNRIFTKLKRAVIVYRKKTICANSEGETEQKTPNEKVQLYLLLAWSSWISFLARMVVNKSFGHQQTNVAILLKKLRNVMNNIFGSHRPVWKHTFLTGNMTSTSLLCQKERIESNGWKKKPQKNHWFCAVGTVAWVSTHTSRLASHTGKMIRGSQWVRRIGIWKMPRGSLIHT